MRKPISNSPLLITVGLCLSFCAANHAGAQNYFGVTAGITTGGTYSWDDANWATTSAGPFTSDWLAGSFARFTGGAGDNYTITVNNSESMAGLYLVAAGATLNINDAGNGTGSLNVASGVQGFLLTGSVIVNATITGVGGVDPEYEGSGGNLSLFGDKLQRWNGADE